MLRNGPDSLRLPTAHTCFNVLLLSCPSTGCALSTLTRIRVNPNSNSAVRSVCGRGRGVMHIVISSMQTYKPSSPFSHCIVRITHLYA